MSAAVETVVVSTDARAAVRLLARAVGAAAHRALRARGRFVCVVEGGEAGVRLVDELLALAPALPWHQIVLLPAMTRPRRLPPAAAAAAYERALRMSLAVRPGRWPPIDLAVLSLAPTGAIGPLAPASEALEAVEAVVVPITRAAGLEGTIGLTFPVLRSAREVAIVALGRDRAEALAFALAEPPADTAAQRLRAVGPPLWWIVDAEAARLVRPA